jgi:hypothetical protein
MDTRRISFVDHAGFHRAALHMAVAGGMAGLAAHVSSLLEPRMGGLAAPLPLAVVAGAAVYGAAAPETRARARDLSIVVLGSAFAAAALSAVRRGDMSAPWGAALFAAALGLLVARGTGGRRFWIAGTAGAAGALLGRFVLGALAGLSFGPAWLVAASAGTAFGVVALLGTLPRHLRIEHVAAAPADTAELLARARQVAGSEPKIGALLEQLDDLGRQSAAAPARGELDARLAQLDARADATADELARAEYVKARAAVAEQLADVQAIETARERVIARLHRELEEASRVKLAATSAEVDATSQALLETDE